MIRSMTGFGRDSSEEENRGFSIEIKSVNHRYLDLNIKMPRNLMALEDRIRKTVQQKISRGKVDIYITQNNYEKQGTEVFFNEALADSYVKRLQEINERYKVRDDISVSLIARMPEVITLEQNEEDLEEIWQSISDVLSNAIDSLVSMREREGNKLKDDILKRCDFIKNMVNSVEKRAPLVVIEYRERLNKRLKELLGEVPIDENRVASEIAVFSDRVSIAEEIVRLNSHLNQVKETVKLDEPVGRKLDFIIQEMNRETNTIGSKANDLELVNLVLNIKNEIEKIREQVQNVE